MVRFLVRHAPTVLLFVACTFAFGAWSYLTLPREAAPDVKIPYVMVTTPYVGVAPDDVESLVTIPIENELAGLRNLKKMRSTSAEGVSMIFLEFEPDVVIEDALQRVRDRVNRAAPKLPEDAEDPEVREISTSDFPILIVSVAGPVDEQVLEDLVEALQDEVERIPGVLDTTIGGGLEREIHVWIDPRRLIHYGLSLSDVVGAIRNENVNIPGGDVDAGRTGLLLRVPGEFTSAEEIERVAVKRVGGRPVFVRDIGRVADGFAERASYARMDGQAAVSLTVRKRAGANIVEIGDEIKRLVAEHAERWPEGVRYRVLADRSERVQKMVDELVNNILTALVLVLGVMFVFMGLRSSLFVSLAIPLSMLSSFAVIQAMGMTLNIVVLFALILALGMLVDNGIVIVENIYRHMEEGRDAVEASIEATNEVAGAVAASTATTVAAFLPLVFWTGVMGEFMGFLPKTVIIVLTASLVVAVAVLPVATSRFLRVRRRRGPGATARPRHPMMRAYRRLLEWSIRRRYASAALSVLTLVVTFVAYGALNHGTEFFPNTDPDRAIVSLRAPDGTDLDAMDALVREVEHRIAGIDNIDVFVAETGVSGGGFEGNRYQSNVARVTVDFLPSPADAKPGQRVRVEPTPVTVQRIRDALEDIPGVEIKVEKERMGPPVGAPIAVEISGNDFDVLGEVAARVQRRLREVEGVTDLRSDYRVGRPEMRLRIDRGAAKRIGASTAAIANTVRTAVAGTRASALRDGKDEHDIVVSLDPRFRDDLQQVLSLRVPGRTDRSPKTFPVPLSTVASYTLAGGSGAVKHVDRDRVVTIEGDVAEGYNENAVRARVDALLAEIATSGELPEGVHLRLGGADDEQRRARAFLSRAFAVALALIAIVLVTQFNGFRLPLIIMGSVVLSIVGVLWGLVITGTPFGVVMTGIGVISLAGVVVNNAIVLLDYVEKLRERGHSVDEALVIAGTTRFRPVMLTAVTTVLGLVPMALGVSVDFRHLRVLTGGSSAQFWGPMAVAVIFGLSLATVLTLVMVPTFYRITEDLRVRLARVGGARGAAPAADAGLALLAALAAAAPATARAGEAVTLEQAWAAAERASIEVRLAAEDTVQADTLRGRAAAVLSPKVSASAGYTVNEYEIVFDPADMIPDQFASLLGEEELGEPIVIQRKTYWSANVSVVQPLLDARSLPALGAARRSMEAARIQEEAVRAQVKAGVARAFYGLALARGAREIAERAVDVARDGVDRARREVAAGRQPERAALQAELALARAERELRAARAAEVQAQVAFARLTGLPRDAEPVLPEPLEAPAGSADEAEAAALSARPDLRAAERRVAAARLERTARRLDWLPTIDGRFVWNYSENTGFSDDPTLWFASVQARWTPWDGGMRIAEARRASSRLRQAELVAERARNQAREEVRVAWARVETARAALEAADHEVALAREGLERAERAFAAGAATWLEVDQARLALHQAELARLRGRVDHDLAVIELRRATGAL